MARIATLLLVVTFVAFAAAINMKYDPRLVQFQQFLHKYEKSYSSLEFQNRFAIFQQNLATIDSLNAKSKSARFGVTKFSDLTQEEFKKLYLGTKPMYRDPSWPMLPNLSNEVLSATPSSWDWRSKGAVTEVKDQGQCGSCWSFSTTGNVEGQWFLAGHTLVELSEQNLVDCDHNCMTYQGQQACDAGCDGGLMPNAFEYIIQNGGIDSEASYPYLGADATCQFNPANVAAKISNWTMVPSDEDQMAAYLVQLGPLSIAVDAELWQFYIGGVLDAGFLCGETLDHGVLIVGFGSQQDIFFETVEYWLIKNSWGADWGESGYIKIYKGDNECGVDLFPCSSLIGNTL